ncbi:MAG: hypothetical protein C0402_01065 [Thermodesulfovibrio sp.]|nr:hypothetical protein [Thermodesulfovibrio sp.]
MTVTRTYILIMLIFPFCFCSSVFAVCPCTPTCAPADTWIAEWTDSFGQTVYELEAPCKVYIDTPFTITATVTDSVYQDDWVGFGWSITDSITGVEASGFSIDTVGSQWQYSFEQTYTGIPLDHTITFGFSDLGEGGGGHNWAGNIIGETTVDPYPLSYYPVKRIPDGIQADYAMSPAEAYAKVSGDGQIIICRTGDYGELVLNLPYEVELEGGYNADFSSNEASFSTISGYIEIANGSVTISNISIQ